MYFNDSKPRPSGERLPTAKLAKKTHKCLEQLKRHDPDVRVSNQPTEILFVGNSSVLCNVTLEELEEIFNVYDENCEFTVYPNKRAYSFVQFSDASKAVTAFNDLNGFVHPALRTSHLPFVISFVENLPNGLSTDSVLCPKDLLVLEDFVNNSEEADLIEFIVKHPKLDTLKHRSVLHFGHEFDYSSNTSFQPCQPIPDIIQQLIDRIRERGLCPFQPDQVTANVYEPGQGIPSHYDTHSAFEDPVISLSMGSDVVMEFKGEMSVPINDSAAARLESAYVADVYEHIASHFDETRHSNWRAVQKFLDSLPAYSLLYDVGCGNGKYLVTADRLLKFGCDLCYGLCEIAHRKGCRVARADGLGVPFREGADAVICIAVLHHLSSSTRRLAFIRELLRLLRPGGRACVTVWNMDQSGAEYAKMRGNKDETTIHEESEGRLKIHDGKDFAQQDVLVPWQVEGGKGDNRGETYLRFYHVFRKGELEALIEEAGDCRLESIESEQGNWIAVIQKS